jgi:PAS domain S-box-containing protein
MRPLRANRTRPGPQGHEPDHSGAGGLLSHIRSWLPEGGSLSDEVWWHRHRVILVLIAIHVPIIALFAQARGFGWIHAVAESYIVAAFGLLAALSRYGRKFRTGAAAVALLTSSAVLVHVSGGLIEMHFHFFVVIGVLTVYQDWQPFLLAVAYVLLHHGIMGMVDPGSVYNHAAARAHPWQWALIHGGFVLAASATYLVAWRMYEEVRSLADASFRQLKDSEERYRSVVDTVREVVFQTDASGRWTFLSPAWATLTGEPIEQRLGRPALDSVHPDDRARCRTAPRESAEFEFRLLTSKGEHRIVEARWRAISDWYGAFAGISGTIHDVTDRRRLENELRHAQKLESVGQLAAGIAHEINTPIQFVGDNLRFLQEAFEELNRVLDGYREVAGAPDPVTALAEARRGEEEADSAFLAREVPEAIDHTLQGVDRVATIVRAMKAFGYPSSHGKVPADLNQAIRDTLVVANNEVKYVADVVTDLGELPPVWCHVGDINQVLLNLVVNAAHAIKEAVGNRGRRGTITIRTSHRGDEVRIDVADTGVGILPEVADRIFEPFFTTKDVGEGTGQGLALAYSLIHDRHNGSITFTSEPGIGTTFTVRLPIVAPRPEPAPVAPAAPAVPAVPAVPVAVSQPLSGN